MNWDELAAAIAKMSPEERRKIVRFVEPYDDFKSFTVTVATADRAITDEDGDVIPQGDSYLC